MQTFEAKREALARMRVEADRASVTPQEAERLGLDVRKDGVRRSVFALLGHAEIGAEAISAAFPWLLKEGGEVLAQVRRDARYAPYLERQSEDVARLRRDEVLSIPAEIDYSAMPGLSRELAQKLDRVRPETIAQASRLEGMTPAALTIVLLRVRRGQLAAAS